MTSPTPVPHQTISAILRHDAKQTSYKIALVRALGDVALAFPDVHAAERDVAVPLRLLAEQWIAYYWPFMDPAAPILQGSRARRGSELRHDMAFRPALTRLRSAWQEMVQVSSPADGFYLVSEFRVPRRRASYQGSGELLAAFEEARRQIADTLQMPIRYAGPGQWSVFARPAPWQRLQGRAVAIPTTMPAERCVVVAAPLWGALRELSLWIEALCVHEWCLFTERVQPTGGSLVERGTVYTLLTARPDNRRPLTWEQNQIDLLLMEDKHFVCPWSGRAITVPRDYAIDHLVPVSLYPINELWNLVPSDPQANSHLKRDRLPTVERLATAEPSLQLVYTNYLSSPAMARAIREDAAVRFGVLSTGDEGFAGLLGASVVRFIDEMARARNAARF